MIAFMYVFTLPESPRWLVARGRNAEALAVLAALDNTGVDDPAVRQTWHGILDAVAAESAEGFQFRQIFTHGNSQNFRRTLIGMLSQCFQQISGERQRQERRLTPGINLITYYLTSVLQDMGIQETLSRVLSGVNGTVYFLTSLVAILLIERWGRRPLMFYMALAQGATMAILAGLYNTNARGNKAAQGVSVLMLFLFNTWFSIGWLGMSWLYPAELTGEWFESGTFCQSGTSSRPRPPRLNRPRSSHSCPRERAEHGDELAVQLLRGHGDWAHVCRYQMGHVRALRGVQHPHHRPGGLDLVPRDEALLARRAGHYLRPRASAGR